MASLATDHISNTRIRWEDSLWFFDIDDTLSDTFHSTFKASAGIRRVMDSHFTPEIGEKFENLTNHYFHTITLGYRVRFDKDWDKVPGGKAGFDNLLTRLFACQKKVIEEYGIGKKWSREVYVKLAAEELNLSVTPQLVDEAARAYWAELSRITFVYSDALAILQTIRAHNRPIYLLTASDSRLIMQEDGQFTYNPAHSESLKRERIELLKEKGLTYDILSIGDPEDKPHLDFFQKAITKAEAHFGQQIDLSKAIMVGDSFGGDLQTPKEKLGFGLVILIDREGTQQVIIDEREIHTNSLERL